MTIGARLRAWSSSSGCARGPIGGTLPGDGFPVVLVDGAAVGIWRLTVKDGGSVELFDTVGARTRARIDARIGEVAALLTG